MLEREHTSTNILDGAKPDEESQSSQINIHEAGIQKRDFSECSVISISDDESPSAERNRDTNIDTSGRAIISEEPSLISCAYCKGIFDRYHFFPLQGRLIKFSKCVYFRIEKKLNEFLLFKTLDSTEIKQGATLFQLRAVYKLFRAVQSWTKVGVRLHRKIPLDEVHKVILFIAQYPQLTLAYEATVKHCGSAVFKAVDIEALVKTVHRVQKMVADEPSMVNRASRDDSRSATSQVTAERYSKSQNQAPKVQRTFSSDLSKTVRMLESLNQVDVSNQSYPQQPPFRDGSATRLEQGLILTDTGETGGASAVMDGKSKPGYNEAFSPLVCNEHPDPTGEGRTIMPVPPGQTQNEGAHVGDESVSRAISNGQASQSFISNPAVTYPPPSSTAVVSSDGIRADSVQNSVEQESSQNHGAKSTDATSSDNSSLPSRLQDLVTVIDQPSEASNTIQRLLQASETFQSATSCNQLTVTAQVSNYDRTAAPASTNSSQHPKVAVQSCDATSSCNSEHEQQLNGDKNLEQLRPPPLSRNVRIQQQALVTDDASMRPSNPPDQSQPTQQPLQESYAQQFSFAQISGPLAMPCSSCSNTIDRKDYELALQRAASKHSQSDSSFRHELAPGCRVPRCCVRHMFMGYTQAAANISPRRFGLSESASGSNQEGLQSSHLPEAQQPQREFRVWHPELKRLLRAVLLICELPMPAVSRILEVYSLQNITSDLLETGVHQVQRDTFDMERNMWAGQLHTALRGTQEAARKRNIADDALQNLAKRSRSDAGPAMSPSVIAPTFTNSGSAASGPSMPPTPTATAGSTTMTPSRVSNDTATRAASRRAESYSIHS